MREQDFSDEQREMDPNDLSELTAFGDDSSSSFASLFMGESGLESQRDTQRDLMDSPRGSQGQRRGQQTDDEPVLNNRQPASGRMVPPAQTRDTQNASRLDAQVSAMLKDRGM